MKVNMYTDGACSGNPGPGGYGTILEFNGHTKELSEGFRKTTNNRMELLAVIKGLEALTREGLEVDIYSDSKYVVDAVQLKWVFGWQKKGFAGKKNPDLWMQFLRLYPKFKIKFIWIKGHAGHPQNEICDQMAVKSSKSARLLIDEGYEAENG